MLPWTARTWHPVLPASPTPPNCPPPQVFERDYGYEADVWSLGMMLYQLYALRFPYWPSYDACKHAGVEEVMQVRGAC